MKLSDYIRDEGLSLDQFAKRIGVSKATVSRLARNLNRPDWSTIDAIERETGGKVDRNDFPAPVQTEAAA